jgi:hypothetical protein
MQNMLKLSLNSFNLGASSARDKSGVIYREQGSLLRIFGVEIMQTQRKTFQ